MPVRRRAAILLMACGWIGVSGVHAALANITVQATDGAGVPRQAFSSTERITLAIRVQNTAASAGNIQFSFEVKDANGARRLAQSGNSAPGSVVGVTGASLQGVPVSQFYNGPGLYTLTGTASLDGETVSGSAAFSVLSPLITLTYPANGARDLIDQPLVFRWVSSGASSYRVSVDDDPSFYNVLFTGQSVGNFLVYPLNTSDDRQRLAAGQSYYWKVEGLDAAGNVVAKTDQPFTFMVKAQSMQTTSKDLAVVSVEKNNEAIPGGAGAMPVAVSIKNQGGRAELGVSVSLFADGAQVPSSPKRIEKIDPGQTVKLVFPVRPPEGDRSVLVNVSLDFLDDNQQNNNLARQFRGDSDANRNLANNEIWDAVRRAITNPDVLAELEGYVVESVAGESMNRDEIEKLIRAVNDGRARVTDYNLKPAE